MSLSRRNFLTWSATAAAGAALTACRGQQSATAPVADVSSTTSTSTSPTTSASSASVAEATTSTTVAADNQDRILVVVQMSGGNDGLNMLVPLDGRYHDLRPTIGHADDKLGKMFGTAAYGLHPSLAPMQSLIDGGQVAAIASVGYPHPTRSHFLCLDDWWSATPGKTSQTGWLGRYMDLTGASDTDPLRAVALGSGVPALFGVTSRPTVVISPESFRIQASAKSKASLVDGWTKVGGPSAVAALEAINVFDKLKLQAAPASTGDEGEGGALAKSLAVAAELIVAGSSARVIHVTSGGFDTHANQVADHAVLMDDLAVGLKHFSERLTAAGLADRALVMTTSEFGRRAKENGSGTDHGKAGVQFLVGPMVSGGVIGATDLGSLDDGDIKPGIDVRSLYATALDWLRAPSSDVLQGQFESLQALRVR